MPRGRPNKSKIRQNMVEILHHIHKATGYDIYKHYAVLFGKVTLRSIYYHLKKGTALGEFHLEEIREEKGDYSWGNVTEKLYYELGPNAKPVDPTDVQEYFSKR